MPARKLFKLLFSLIIILLITTLSLFYLLNSKENGKMTEYSPMIKKDENFPVATRGVDRLLLSGQLKEKPFVDEDGLLMIKLEMEDEGGKSINVNVYGAILPNQDGAQTLPLTKTETLNEDPIWQLKQESILLSIEDIVSELNSVSGEKIALSILSGDEATMKSFFNDTFLTGCTGNCMSIKDKLNNSLIETMEGLNSLQSEDVSQDELILTVLLMNIYVEK